MPKTRRRGKLMRSGYYQTDYIAQLPPNLIEQPIEVIAEHIFDNVYRQAYPRKAPYVFPKISWSWLLNNPQRYKMPEAAKKGPIERVSHGSQHVSRVGLDTVIFLNLYIASAPKTKDKIQKIINEVPGADINAKRATFIKYLQIAALFHDAGRYGDGEDISEWEYQGAKECKAFLRKLGCPEALAHRFGQAAEHKDENIAHTSHKDILRKLVQNSDCIDIQRCASLGYFFKNLPSRYIIRPRTRQFGIHYLDIWKDANSVLSTPEENQLALQKEIIELAIENRSLIASQSDLSNPCPIEVKIEDQTLIVSPGIATSFNEADKRVYEHGVCMYEVNESLKRNAFLRKWANNGKMLDFDHDHKHLFENQNAIASTGGNAVLAAYIKPLQEAIDASKEIDQTTVSLINLKCQLLVNIKKDFHHEIQTGTLTANHLQHSVYGNVPAAIKQMHVAVNDNQTTRQARLDAIRHCDTQLQPILQSNMRGLATAVAFVVVSAVGAVVGATLGMLAGVFAGGAAGHLPGAGLGALAGFAFGALKGWTIGGAVAAGAGLGVSAGVTTFWQHKHTGIRETLHTILDSTEAKTKRQRR